VRWLFAPVDVAPLVLTRIVFGALMAVDLATCLAGDFIAARYVEPDFWFTFPGFAWVRPLPGAGMTWLFVALVACAAMIAVGLCHRVAAVAFALGMTWILLVDQTHYLNHQYLICLLALLLAVAPADAAGSIDAWRRGGARPRIPAWSVRLLQVQIAIVYVYAGVAKLDADWLSGAFAGLCFAQVPLLAPYADDEVLTRTFAFAGLLFDLLVVPGLLWRRTRWLATGAAVLFHGINSQLFSIGVFPWLMLGTLPLLWPPTLARSILVHLRVLRAGAMDSPATPTLRHSAAITAVCAAYLTIQLVVPLRHFAYPGHVSWTEQGHMFAWHMMLRDKRGQVHFELRDPTSGRTWIVDPRQHLTARQVHKMATRPELIRIFAGELARRHHATHGAGVEVRARTSVRLNRREAQPLVDPTVDLAEVPFSFAPASWIVPLRPSPTVLSNAWPRRRERVAGPMHRLPSRFRARRRRCAPARTRTRPCRPRCRGRSPRGSHPRSARRPTAANSRRSS
jgi:hypothetical protein